MKGGHKNPTFHKLLETKDKHTERQIKMTDFIQVFTVTHLTYLFIVPFFVMLLATLFFCTSELLAFNANNIFLYVFSIICLLLVMGKSFSTLEKAPYFNARMEQFNPNEKLKSLEY